MTKIVDLREIEPGKTIDKLIRKFISKGGEFFYPRPTLIEKLRNIETEDFKMVGHWGEPLNSLENDIIEFYCYPPQEYIPYHLTRLFRVMNMSERIMVDSIDIRNITTHHIEIKVHYKDMHLLDFKKDKK